MDSGVVLRVLVMDDDDNTLHKELVECRSSSQRAIRAFSTRTTNRMFEKFPDARRVEINIKERE